MAVWVAKARKQASRRTHDQNWKLALISTFAGFRNSPRQAGNTRLIDSPKESGWPRKVRLVPPVGQASAPTGSGKHPHAVS